MLQRDIINISILFRDYIEFGRSLNEKFDVILDDGRARVHVALSVLR